MNKYPALTAILNQYISHPEQLESRTRDKLGGACVKNLRFFLWEYAHGMCVVCELETVLDPGKENSAEVGHLIPASHYAHSKVRAGYAPGNVANMCKDCNRRAGDFPFHLWLNAIRSDLIPCEWPSLYKKWNPGDDHTKNARLARMAKGLPF